MFKNIVTLVTGGASGLGLGTVNRFAKKGAKVIMTDLPSSNGVEVAKVIGHDVRYIPADIRSEIDLKNLIDEIDKTYGQLNVVVNCAGIANAHIIHNYNRGACRNLDNFMDVIQTNLIGTYKVIRSSVQLMSKNQPDEYGRRGVYINTAGVEGIRGHSGQVATAAASNGIMTMTKSLAKEFHEQGIRVVTIAPGLIKTPLTDYYPPQVEKTLEKECILAPQRFGDPDEYAYLAHTIVQNPHINATTIELASGLNIIMNM